MTSSTLTMDKPHPTSLLDTGAQDVIGKPIDRIDGPLKVAGRATYAAEYPVEHLAYGYLARSRVGRGKITAVHDHAVRAIPASSTLSPISKSFIRNPQQGGETKAPAQGVEEIAYLGQIVAIVVAERL